MRFKKVLCALLCIALISGTLYNIFPYMVSTADAEELTANTIMTLAKGIETETKTTVAPVSKETEETTAISTTQNITNETNENKQNANERASLHNRTIDYVIDVPDVYVDPSEGEAFDNDIKISVTGKLPADAELQVVTVPLEKVADIVVSTNEEETVINPSPIFAADISILSGGEKFQPADFGEEVKIEFANLPGDRLLHIKKDVTDQNGKIDNKALNATLDEIEKGKVETEKLDLSLKNEALTCNVNSFSLMVVTDAPMLKAAALSVTPRSGTVGTGLSWTIDAEGNFELFPTNGVSGTLPTSYSSTSGTKWPWYQYHDDIATITIKGTVGFTGDAHVGMFLSCPNLETVDLSGFDFTETTNIGRMFQDCPKLTSVDFTTAKFNNGTKKANMKFLQGLCNGCTSLTEFKIDWSQMDLTQFKQGHEMFMNCSSLTSLDLSGIGPITRTDGVQVNNMLKGCTALKTLNLSNFNTDTITNQSHWNMGLSTCTALETLIATNSNIRIKNNNSSIYDFPTSITWWRESTGEGTVHNYAAIKSAIDGNNGFLPADVYYKEGTSGEEPIPVGPFGKLPETFYIIDSLGKYKVEYLNLNYYIERTAEGGGSLIWTVNQRYDKWNSQGGDYLLDSPIKIRYYNAATDANGEKHDVIITFNSFTIKDTTRVPSNGETGYRRHLLTIQEGSLLLSNYAIKREGGYMTQRGSGTWADMTVEIDGAPENTTFLFCGDHLNKAHLQEGDYTPGAEGVILGDGFNIENVKTVEGNTLKRYSYNGSAWVEDPNGNYIMAGDNDASNIDVVRFYTSGNAQGSNFTWTSGMACDTHLFGPGTAVNTFDPLLPMYLKLKANKTLNGAAPESSYNSKFTFTMTANPQSIVDGEINYANRDGAPTVGTATYENGVVSISNMKFTTAGTYFYVLKENAGNINGMTYDTTERNIKIVVDWRKDDDDLHEHLKAKVFVDGVETISLIKSQDTTRPIIPYNPVADLPVWDTGITFENNLVLDLEIQNTVRGNMGNRMKEFDFTVKVPYLAGKTTMVYVNGAIANWTFDENGEKTFKLKHGESIKIPNLPSEIKYSVTETIVDGYVQRYTLDGFLTPSNETGEKDFNKSTLVVFENYKEIELPAGILMSFGPAVIGIIIVLIIFSVLILSKKLKKKDDNDDE